MDTEARAAIEADIDAGLNWARATMDRLTAIGHPAMEVLLVEHGADFLAAVVTPDEDGTATLLELAVRLAPTVVFYTEDTDGPGVPSVTFHLAWEGSWVGVICYVADAAPSWASGWRARLVALLPGRRTPRWW